MIFHRAPALSRDQRRFLREVNRLQGLLEDASAELEQALRRENVELVVRSTRRVAAIGYLLNTAAREFEYPSLSVVSDRSG